MVYDSALDSQIHAQLLEIEDDLLDISIVDPPTLAGFVTRLAHLTEETTRCLKGGYLSPKTIHLARNVALGGKLIANKLIQIHRVTQDVEQKRESDIADVFARMSLSEKTQCTPTVSPVSEGLPLADASRKYGEKDVSVPSYISNACEWLRKHYHNPYPTIQEKKKILGNTGTSIGAVDSWFKNARKRIGWSSLANRFFRNSRSELIDCAFRVFIKPNPAFPVKQEIAQLFKQVEANVEKLYNEDLQTHCDASPARTHISPRRKVDISETENEASYLNPLKSSTALSSSSVPSLATCPSESGVSSSPSLTTPTSSPSQATLPLERLDGWIGDLRAEAAFLPHDLSDKPQSVLSVKRASSDSISDAPPKRARVEKSRISNDLHESEKPEYKARSCEWLLANLHNPYPTHVVKAKIASEASVPVKTVEDWFTSTRQQIGWASIMKTFFRGCRAEAVDCAMSVLTGEPTRQPILDGPREALLAMKASAISLLESRQDVSETLKRIEADFNNHFSSATTDYESRTKNIRRNGASKARRVKMDRSFNTGDDKSTNDKPMQEQPKRISNSKRSPPPACSSEEETFSLLPSHSEPVRLDESHCSSRKRRLSSSEPDEEPARKRHQISSNAYNCSDILISSDLPDIFEEGFNSTLDSSGSPETLDQPHTDMGDLFNHAPLAGPNSITGADSDLLTLFRPEDFDYNLSGFPFIPDFNVDWSSICSPSIEGFAASEIYQPSFIMPGSFNALNVSDSPCPSSTFTSVDSPSTHTFSFGKLLSQSDDALPDPLNIFGLV